MTNMNIHLFQHNGHTFLFDTNTCTPLEINSAAYSVLQMYKTMTKEEILSNLSSEYDINELLGVFEEIEFLKEQGLLSSSPIEFQPVSPSEVSKVKIKQLMLMVAQDCNLGCTYCFGNQGTYGHKGKMSEEIAYRAIDFVLEQSPNLREFIVCFFGGEPLINFPVIEKVVDYCEQVSKSKNVKIYFHMTTNGTILDDRILECIKKHNIVVLVSIDGSEEIHDKYRKFRNGKGTFKVIAENVKRMSQHFPVHARVTITKYSESLTHLCKILSEMGIKDIYFSPVTKEPSCNSCKDQNFEDMGLTDSQLLALETEFNKIAKEFTEKCNSEEASYILHNMLKLKMFFSKIKRNCGCGGELLAIAADGTLYPCHRFVDLHAFKLGNIWDGLNGESYANFFNEFDRAREKKCKECWAVNTCAGGCANEAVVDGCRFGEPNESRCLQIRVQKEGAVYLHMKENEKRNEAI